MKTAQTNIDPAWEGIGRIDGIRVFKDAPRQYAGSCNACTDHTHTTVTEVHLRGMSFRLCDVCRPKLLELLK